MAALMRRFTLRMTLVAVIVGVVLIRAAAAQTIGLVVVGDTLRPRAATFTFIDGLVLDQLRDGRSLTIDIELTVRRNDGTRLAGVAHTFTLSFDLWEERFAVSRAGDPPRAISHVRARDAEAWCLDQLAVPRSAVAGVGRDTAIRLRLESRARAVRPAEDKPPSVLGQLIESLSRRRTGGDIRRTLDAGPLRLQE